jgi:hypothetical protein
VVPFITAIRVTSQQLTDEVIFFGNASRGQTPTGRCLKSEVFTSNHAIRLGECFGNKFGPSYSKKAVYLLQGLDEVMVAHSKG